MLPAASRWTCDAYPAREALGLAEALGVSAATAAVLARRGLGDVGAARAFLAADERHPATALPGMGAACELILRHVREGSRVVVFGDYDVDGVCATAIALRGLRAVGADPRWRLPSRDEGYGLSEAAVRELAAAGAGLIVTVDCGVTAVEQVALARSLGVDVVVTDHHRPGAELPDCPVVHPGLGGYPFEHLCGAAVALKLSEALRGDRADRAGDDPEADTELAGLATLCDMVPLVGENRRIAREGLAALARTRSPGLRALMAVAQLDPGECDERAAGFRLGPRLNAAGRLGRADAALELLTTADGDRAAEIARELDGLNHDRRETEQRILAEAEAQCAPQLASAAIVVAGEGWHPGVVGIVASRLVERHRRPCVVIALDGERGRGSGRSIGPYDLHAGLGAVGDRLIRHGGHRMAAGLEIDAREVPAFRAALAAHAAAALTPADLMPVQEAHAVVAAGALTLDLAEDLERLAPFGAGNPAPVLVVPAARIEHVTAMGAEREHARFTLAGGPARARGVAFRTSQRALAEAGAADQDVAVSLERNRWNGRVEPRVVLRSLTPTRAGAVRDLAPGPPLADAVAAELAADPTAWWPERDAPAARPASADDETAVDLHMGGQVHSRPGPSDEPAVDPRIGGKAHSRLGPSDGPAVDPHIGGETRSRSWGPAGGRAGAGAGKAPLVLERHGEGFAGPVGDLLTSGERVLAVVADVSRRRDGLERLVAGLAPDGMAVVGWEALLADPGLADGFAHLACLDPPPVTEALDRVMAAVAGQRTVAHPSAGQPAAVHLLWGEPEREFALACWRERLDLRPALVELWRRLDTAGALTGDELEAALHGDGQHPRTGRHCGRLVRVLVELGLATWEAPRADAPARLVRGAAERTDLDRSPAHRAYTARLAAAARYLGPAVAAPAARSAS